MKGSDNMGKNNNISANQLKEWGEVTSYIREIAKKKNVDLSKILLVKKENYSGKERNNYKQTNKERTKKVY